MVEEVKIGIACLKEDEGVVSCEIFGRIEKSRVAAAMQTGRHKIVAKLVQKGSYKDRPQAKEEGKARSACGTKFLLY